MDPTASYVRAGFQACSRCDVSMSQKVALPIGLKKSRTLPMSTTTQSASGGITVQCCFQKDLLACVVPATRTSSTTRTRLRALAFFLI